MFFLVELWAWTLCAEVVLTIQHLLGCCILGETSQRRSAPVTKFSQPRAWISLKRASAAPQSKTVLCNSFLYTNNIQKYYSVSRYVISIIIVFAPTLCKSLHVRNQWCGRGSEKNPQSESTSILKLTIYIHKSFTYFSIKLMYV